MLEFFATLHWGAVFQIIIIDILLGGDNAVVIALACRNLPAKQRTRGVLFGTLGAILLRVALIAFAVVLLDVPFLKFVGGVLLLWIGIKLMMPGHEDHHIDPSDRLWAAIKTIIVADAVMSLDNVLAIAAAAGGHTGLIIMGLVISIPLVVFGATLLTWLLDRLPILVWAGSALLGWVAGELLATEPILQPYLIAAADSLGVAPKVLMRVVEGSAAVLVVLAGWVLTRTSTRHAAKQGAE